MILEKILSLTDEVHSLLSDHFPIYYSDSLGFLVCNSNRGLIELENNEGIEWIKTNNKWFIRLIISTPLK